MAQLLDENITQQLKNAFEKLQQPVHICFFGSKEQCETCSDTRQLLQEVTAISDKLSLSVHDIQAEVESAKKFNVDKVPCLVITAKDGEKIIDYGIRFAGMPAGHEFASLIQDMLLVSNRDSGLSAQTREFLRELKEPVNLQVFVTPT